MSGLWKELEQHMRLVTLLLVAMALSCKQKDTSSSQPAEIALPSNQEGTRSTRPSEIALPSNQEDKNSSQPAEAQGARKDIYQLSPDANTIGTYRLAEVKISPKRLIECFGKPLKGDYKISGEYIFVDDAGNVFTLYDWKSTTLYEGYGPTPEQFWSKSTPEELCIGGLEGKGDVRQFKNWLLE